jgi:hypothetical protein
MAVISDNRFGHFGLAHKVGIFGSDRQLPLASAATL